MRITSLFAFTTSVLLIAITASAAGPIEIKPLGVFDACAASVTQYTLTNKTGASCTLIDYGAIVTKLMMPDKDGKLGDVVLGYDTPDGYALSGPFMGCIAGRFANRIANGGFVLDGTQYYTTMNQGTNTLHGGFKGLAKRQWQADTGMTPDGPTVRFHILDPDGTEGFPGNLDVTVLYTLTNDNILKIQYYAKTDKATPINLTHHSYFNLSGTGQGDVLGDVCRIYASRYLPVDGHLIPLGEVAPVTGTPFDFTKAKLIGTDIKAMPGTPPGYDHTMVLDKPNMPMASSENGAADDDIAARMRTRRAEELALANGNSATSAPSAGKPAFPGGPPSNGDLTEAAVVYDPNTHRQLECWTTEPAVHFFTGANLGNVKGKNGVTYQPYQAFCFETQHYPDSPNHPNFPNTILRPGMEYRQLTEFKFSVAEKPLAVGQ